MAWYCKTAEVPQTANTASMSVQIPGSLAACDGRLKPDDRVLEINSTDLMYGSQEQAAHIIQVGLEVFNGAVIALLVVSDLLSCAVQRNGFSPPLRRIFPIEGIFPLELTWVLTPFSKTLSD